MNKAEALSKPELVNASKDGLFDARNHERRQQRRQQNVFAG
jgi:hypothetical protein